MVEYMRNTHGTAFPPGCGVQQEHSPANTPNDGLAGTQKRTLWACGRGSRQSLRWSLRRRNGGRDRHVFGLGRARWLDLLAFVIDCRIRELLGPHLSRSRKGTAAANALEQELQGSAPSAGRRVLAWRAFRRRQAEGRGPRPTPGASPC